MNFADVFKSNELPITAPYVSSAICRSTIWTLRADNCVYLFRRPDYKKFQKFSFQAPNSSEKAMFVDPAGERCMIFASKSEALYFRLSDQLFKPISVPSDLMLTSGCWITEEDGTIVFLFGTQCGKILMAVPDRSNRCSYLFANTVSAPVLEFQTICGAQRLIFSLIGENILCFFGKGDLVEMFSRGPSNFIVPIGSIPKNKDSKIHRISADPDASLVRLYALTEYGILQLTAVERKNGMVSFDQEITPHTINGISIFQNSSLGMLYAGDAGVSMQFNQKTSVSIPLPDIVGISVEDKQIIMLAECHLFEFEISKLREFLCSAAIENADMEQAMKLADLEQLNFKPIKSYISGASDAGTRIASFHLPMMSVVSQMGSNPRLLLSYFEAILMRINKRFAAQRKAIAEWSLFLMIEQLPAASGELLSFIEQYKDILSMSDLLKKFGEISFSEGIKKVSEVYGRPDILVSLLISSGDFGAAIKALEKASNPDLFSESIVRIWPKVGQNVVGLIRETKAFAGSSVLPLLAHFPDAACEFLTPYSSALDAQIICFVSSCRINKEDLLAEFAKSQTVDLKLVLRFCRSFGCMKAASQVLARLGLIESAIKTAVSVRDDFANEIIDSISDEHQKKSAYLWLLRTCGSQHKVGVLREILSKDMFPFEDIIDFIDNQDKLFGFSSTILKATDSIGSETQKKRYQTHFPPKKSSVFTVPQSSICCVCHLPLLGAHFMAFPCGHLLHSACLKGDRFSCPICGFNRLALSEKPFC